MEGDEVYTLGFPLGLTGDDPKLCDCASHVGAQMGAPCKLQGNGGRPRSVGGVQEIGPWQRGGGKG